MDGFIDIEYSFRFKDGSVKSFGIRLDERDLRFIRPDTSIAPPPWSVLGYNRCTNCPLDPAAENHCPIALNLAEIVEGFKDYFAFEDVSVTVKTAERTFMKDTTIQEGLGGMIGIVMVTSGCPVMEKLKPMVRFHLPFASITETIFRTVSMYIIGQFFVLRDGKEPNWSLSGLEEIYEQVGAVNRDFSIRLRDAAKKDANVNALVNLDCFATMVSLTAEDILEELKHHYSSYLK